MKYITRQQEDTQDTQDAQDDQLADLILSVQTNKLQSSLQTSLQTFLMEAIYNCGIIVYNIIKLKGGDDHP